MAYIVINEEGCKACMLCVEFCPRQCIALGEHLNSRGHHPASLVHPDQCTGCRICALMCPDVCIEVYRDTTHAAASTVQATS